MIIEPEIDCPALHHRAQGYPFGDRVPRTVRMVKTVTADICGCLRGGLRGY